MYITIVSEKALNMTENFKFLNAKRQSFYIIIQLTLTENLILSTIKVLQSKWKGYYSFKTKTRLSKNSFYELPSFQARDGNS